MSITKHVFTGTSLEAQASEMLSWLQANGTDFFDSISMDSNVITCSKDGKNALVLRFNGTDKDITLCLANGEASPLDSVGALYNYAVKTSTGILLNNQGTSNFPTHLFITKTNNNDLAFAVTGYWHNYGHFFMGDFSKSSHFDDVYGQSDRIYIDYVAFWGITSSLTTLTPLCIKTPATYTPDLNFMRFCEFPQIEGKISIGGVEYYSNGYLALKE